MGSYFKNAAFAAAAVLAASLALPAQAETQTVRLAKQFGISYLPMTVMEEKGLIEQEGAKRGLKLKAEWLRFTGGSGMNEALLSGNLDVAGGGVGPMLTIWGRTRNNMQVKGIASLNAMPLYLVTVNPDVKSLKDFKGTDKIAVPAVKTSIQAVTLQMAAEKEFGPGQQNRLDKLTVSMGHPDAQLAMMGGKSEVTAHFGSSPFQEAELKDPRARKVVDSYEVLGGPHTFNVLWATSRFAREKPEAVEAIIAALEEANRMIREDPEGMAELWIKAEKVNMDPKEAADIIRAPANEWTTTPKNVLKYLDYMHRAGLVTSKTDDWKDLFFENIHDASGS